MGTAESRRVEALNPDYVAALERFGIDEGAHIATAGESSVYALDEHRILRLTASALEHYEHRAHLHDEIRDRLPFRVPRMLDGGAIGKTVYTIEERLLGSSLDHALVTLTGPRRKQALEAFADAAVAIGELPFDRGWFGEILYEPPIRKPTWGGYLLERARTNAEIARDKVARDVPDLEAVLDRFTAAVAAVDDVHPALVHGDYFPGNVMVDDDLAIIGVIDWSFLTQCGDRMMDLAGAVLFLEIERPWCTRDDARLVFDHLRERVTAIDDVIDLYRTFYALDFIAYPVGPSHYRWCVDVLRSAVGKERT